MANISVSVSDHAKKLIKKLPYGKLSNDINEFILKNYGDIKFLNEQIQLTEDDLFSLKEKREKAMAEAKSQTIKEAALIKETKKSIGPLEMSILKESKRLLKTRPDLLQGRTNFYNNEFGTKLKPQQFEDLLKVVEE